MSGGHRGHLWRLQRGGSGEVKGVSQVYRDDVSGGGRHFGRDKVDVRVGEDGGEGWGSRQGHLH